MHACARVAPLNVRFIEFCTEFLDRRSYPNPPNLLTGLNPVVSKSRYTIIASPRTAGFTQNKHAWNKQWRPPRLRGSQTNFWETASIIEHVFVIEQRRPDLVVPSHCTKGMFPWRCGKDERTNGASSVGIIKWGAPRTLYGDFCDPMTTMHTC